MISLRQNLKRLWQLIYELGNKQWDIPRLRELLETILPEKTTFDNYEVEHDFASIGTRTSSTFSCPDIRVMPLPVMVFLTKGCISFRNHSLRKSWQKLLEKLWTRSQALFKDRTPILDLHRTLKYPEYPC